MEKYIDLMMQADRYLTDKEKSAIELYFELNAYSAAEYNALKEQYPDALVGFEQNGQFEFYGEDARKICELTGGKLLERETALGTVTVTGFPREQWVYRAKQLWECGENIYLAGLNEDGTHHLRSVRICWEQSDCQTTHSAPMRAPMLSVTSSFCRNATAP